AQRCTSAPPKYGEKVSPRLRRRRESSGKWVCFQTATHLFISPGIRACFIEESDADDADITGVVMFLDRVGLAHWAESKCRHRLGGLPKSFHHQLAMWINDVTAFPKGSGP